MTDEERLTTIERARGLVQGGETPPEVPIHVVIGLTTGPKGRPGSREGQSQDSRFA
jgi:hypothetical protein